MPEPGGTRHPLARRLGTAAGYLALFAASWVVASVLMDDRVPIVGVVLLAVAAVTALVLRRTS